MCVFLKWLIFLLLFIYYDLLICLLFLIYVDFYFVIYRYCFLCNCWLVVEEDDGMIDRLFLVVSKEDMINF